MHDIPPIKLGGHRITIEEKNECLEWGHLEGYFIPTTMTIYIRTDIPAQRQALVLLHELVHAVETIYLCASLDEPVVTNLAEGLFDLFRNNPHVLEVIRGLDGDCNTCTVQYDECDDTDVHVGVGAEEEMGVGDFSIEPTAVGSTKPSDWRLWSSASDCGNDLSGLEGLEELEDE